MKTNLDTLFHNVAIQDIDLAAWNAAWEAWLERRSKNTQRAYKFAWDDLGAFCNLSPWEITSSVLERWQVHMKRRDLSASTIRQRLAAVSSFFGFVSEKYMIMDLSGRETNLYHYNPARGVDAPRSNKYDL